MNTAIRTLVSAVAFGLALSSAQAHINPRQYTHPQAGTGTSAGDASSAAAPATSGIKNPLGVPVSLDQADRTIHIDDHTHWVNVTRMESVRFVVGDGGDAKAFAWRFDGVPQRPFTLDRIAPAGTPGSQGVTVYVSRNAAIEGS